MANIKEIDFMFEIAFNKNLSGFYDQAIRISDEKVLFTSELKEIPQLFNKIYIWFMIYHHI